MNATFPKQEAVATDQIEEFTPEPAEITPLPFETFKLIGGGSSVIND